MERGFRFRTAGLIFYLLLALYLSSSPTFQDRVPQALKSPESGSLIAALLGAGLLLFTSDAVGYVFSSVFIFAFNLTGGYSGIYSRNLSYGGFREAIIRALQSLDGTDQDLVSHASFIHSLPRYRHDQLLVYFLWHTDDLPKSLDAWIERRHTAYLTAWTTVLGIGLAALLTLCLFRMLGLSPSNFTWTIFGLSALVAFMLIFNAHLAMHDALRAIDLRLAAKMNPDVRDLHSRLNPPTSKTTKAVLP